MAGRPPKPTALKLLSGSAGHRPVNPLEPQPDPGASPPTWLSPEARVVWDQLAPVLLKNGLLTELDGEALAHLCIVAVMFRENPTIRLSREYRAYLTMFGMHPSGRTRVTRTPPKPPPSLLSKYRT